jgi:hypothetical protein
VRHLRPTIEETSIVAKRAWSTEFTPPTRLEKPININVSNVPFKLRQRFGAKCKREGKSQRNLLLGWIRNWVEGRRPDEDANDEKSTAEVA